MSTSALSHSSPSTTGLLNSRTVEHNGNSCCPLSTVPIGSVYPVPSPRLFPIGSLMRHKALRARNLRQAWWRPYSPCCSTLTASGCQKIYLSSNPYRHHKTNSHATLPRASPRESKWVMVQVCVQNHPRMGTLRTVYRVPCVTRECVMRDAIHFVYENHE